MRLKLTLVRPDRPVTDIVVTVDATVTMGEVARAIISRDPDGAQRTGADGVTLRARLPGSSESVTLPEDGVLGDSWLASGATVSVAASGGTFTATDRGARPVVATVVISGAAGTHEHQLRQGSATIGRDPDCDITIDDPLISKVHARLLVSDIVEVVDLNSANGILVDGGQVARLKVTVERTVQLGDTSVTVTVHKRGQSSNLGPIRFVRSPKVEPRYPGQTFPGPEVPEEREREPFPWIAIISPAIAGLGFWIFTQSVQALAFVALSPILAAANFLSSVQRQRQLEKRSKALFDARLTELTAELEAESLVERATRLAEVPSTAEVFDDCLRLGSTLWTRRPEHWSFLTLRLGTGDMPSRNVIDFRSSRIGTALPGFQPRADEVKSRFATVPGVPVVESLADVGAVGIVGDLAVSADVLRALLVHLVGLHAPSEVSICALTGAGWSAELDWLKWLPHTSEGPLATVSLADNPARCSALLSTLESMIALRSGAERPRRARGAVDVSSAIASVAARPTAKDAPITVLPAVVVVITHDADVDRDRLVRLTENAADAGVFPIWVERTADRLPGACRAFLDLSNGRDVARVGLVRLGLEVSPVRTEGLSVEAALQFARLLSPVVEVGVVGEDAGDLPRSISIVDLLGVELADSSSAIVDRWRQTDSMHDRSGAEPVLRSRPGRLRALVGQAGVDAMHLDLREQGPHALVGGTTGSGKSEFLQTWVLGMAAEYSPDRVTFLFVDYKGGSAFAECVNLPHCVGLVTDLSPHLVRRALTSLRAELHHREHLFNRKKAKDLLELERRGDPESPPALVLVIDEFAALAKEVPEFVDGVVDIAQRGRSLGIHLIMATQRPAGVIRDNLRANTNLRIALRMADESDSQDVIDDKQAAFFDPSIPGRGVAKTGPGRLTAFQSAYAGGWTTAVARRPEVEVAEQRFGSESLWLDPAPPVVDPDAQRGPTDQARLVTAITKATKHAALPAPRRPWLDELASAYDILKLHQRTDTQIVFGVVDVPERQLQEPAYFNPDVDGNLIVYGTSGSGKSTTLRTLATAAAITPRGGPVWTYGLDFGSGGLRMLDALPHVGSIINGDDTDRVIRLVKFLLVELDRRAEHYSAVNAATISEYRAITGSPDEPRILLLLDNFGAFRDQYEMGSGKSEWFAGVQRILSDGRPLGIHTVLTADRPGAVPGTFLSNISRKIVHRMSEPGHYTVLDVPSDVLGPTSPPGRAILDRLEGQVAVLGASPRLTDQSRALAEFARAVERSGRPKAEPIGTLPDEVRLSELPESVNGRPVLGISDDELAPVGFDPSGVILLTGPPRSGRTTALHSFAQSIRRAEPSATLTYFGNRRSVLSGLAIWSQSLTVPSEVAQRARELIDDLETDSPRQVIVVESIGDFLSTLAEDPLSDLVKAVRRTDHLLIAEAETSVWSSSWPPLGDVKSARRGLALKPETYDGESIFRTDIPRVSPSDFPVGRGLFIDAGRSMRVQIPLPE